MRLSVRLALVCAVLCVPLLGGCADEERGLWQGYVEGDFVYVAPPLGGRLDALDVTRGDSVCAGQRLFVLERAREKAAVDEAERALDEAESTLADRQKGLRPSEVAAVRARLKEAKAAQRLAEAEYARREALFAARTISREELDTAHTAHEQAVQRVREAQAELKTASLGSRDDAVRAAQAAVESARARLEQARWSFDQKVQNAPANALVFDVVRRPGEWVPAGGAVVSLLPPANRKVRFYVPEAQVGGFEVGQRLLVSYDGLAQPLPVTLAYISPEAEYTPPVIYSSQSRAKLVFLLEARPAPSDAVLLKPGQPVDVARAAEGFIRKAGLLDRIKAFVGGGNG